MTGHRITLLGSQDRKLRTWLNGHPDNHERGVIVLFRKLNREVSELNTSSRFVAIDVIEMADDWIIDSSPVHLRINLRNLPAIYLRCEQEKLELGFVHSHPGGILEFSEKDNENEKNILKGYAGCNGREVSLISMILAENQWRARVRTGDKPQDTQRVRHISILDEKININLDHGYVDESGILKRQETAFGKPFNLKLQSLRVAVVGAGGTGSSVATLLARAGIGELIIIDGDVLEESNLNRVRGYYHSDIGKSKAATLAKFIQNIGLPISVISINEFVDQSPIAIDAVSSADIVFGCTDDVAGRDLLNQAMYYYRLVYIDMGLTGKIDTDDEGIPYLRDHRGRISTILPEHGACLRCQRVVTENKLKYERALQDNPELCKLDPETLRSEYYLIGGGESAPGVGPFTSATADSAVAALMDLIRPYRKMATDLRQDNIWHDFVHMTIHSNQPHNNDECFCCGSNGLLLATENGYRLGMPSLGKID